MNIQPYLYFDGRSQEAIDFYKGAIDAKVEMVMLFKEAPAEMQSQIKPGMGDKIMHACIKVGDTPVFVSDGHCKGGPLQFQGITLTINADSDADAEKLFATLGEGGQIQKPMTETFFATRFGMLADKFGVGWMVLAPKQMG